MLEIKGMVNTAICYAKVIEDEAINQICRIKLVWDSRKWDQRFKELRESDIEDVVVGYVGTVRSRLNDFGITSPEMDYPEKLEKYLGRKVWKSRINTINCNPNLWPLFVKSVEDKKFTGVVVRTTKDLISCGSCYENSECLCSEIVNFAAKDIKYERSLNKTVEEGTERLLREEAKYLGRIKSYDTHDAKQ